MGAHRRHHRPRRHHLPPVQEEGRPDRSPDLLSPASPSYGRWLRNRSGLKALDGTKLSVQDAEDTIRALLEVLQAEGLVEKVYDEPKAEVPGFQINEAALQWGPGDGTRRAVDILRVTTDDAVRPGQPLLPRLLPDPGHQPRRAQRRRTHRPSARRASAKAAKTAFREGDLRVLYCSPTMELGVDISTLNAVGMRNVPPTPANYAQRSGRAGRAGSPALVVTYCATGSGHDQFYFRRSDLMVSGQVAPPRLDLSNEDLIRAHVHAIWLAETGQDLHGAMQDIVDLDDDGAAAAARPSPQPSPTRARRSAPSPPRTPSCPVPARSPSAAWWKPGWLDEVVRQSPTQFDRSINRWRGLYKNAQAEALRQTEIANNLSVDARRTQRRQGAPPRGRSADRTCCAVAGEDRNQSDFYPYRYLASEGFLPGYSFPRLPLAAFIPAGRSTKAGEGDYVQRPRFLAITEFGPGAFIYHEGARYAVHRVQIPVGSDPSGGPLLESAEAVPRLRVPAQAHRRRRRPRECASGPAAARTSEPVTSATCCACRPSSPAAATASPPTRRNGTGPGSTSRPPSGSNRTENGPATPSSRSTTPPVPLIATLTYGDTALIRRMNIGYRPPEGQERLPAQPPRRTVGQELRHPRSSRPRTSTPEANPSPPARPPRWSSPTSRTAATRSWSSSPATCPMSRRSPSSTPSSAASPSRSSWKTTNSPSNRCPAHADRRLLLFYENSEGGAGALRRFAMDTTVVPQRRRAKRSTCATSTPRPATTSTTPSTPSASAPPNRSGANAPATTACCPTATSPTTSPSTGTRPRTCSSALRDATLEVGAGGQSRQEQYETLLAESTTSAEKQFLKWLFERGYRLPTHAQYRVADAEALPGLRLRR